MTQQILIGQVYRADSDCMKNTFLVPVKKTEDRLVAYMCNLPTEGSLHRTVYKLYEGFQLDGWLPVADQGVIEQVVDTIQTRLKPVINERRAHLLEAMVDSEFFASLQDNKPQFHRTIARVTFVREHDFTMRIVGWNPRKVVRRPRSLVPFELEPGMHLLVKTNIKADDAEDLLFMDWELAPEPDPDDGLV